MAAGIAHRPVEYLDVGWVWVGVAMVSSDVAY